VIEDLGPENFNQQLWWAVGRLANMELLRKREQICFRNEHSRKDLRGVNLISEALPLGPLWYLGQTQSGMPIGSAKFSSRSENAVIRVYDQAGKVIEKILRPRPRRLPRRAASCLKCRFRPNFELAPFVAF
jgi:hypothetical protein